MKNVMVGRFGGFTLIELLVAVLIIGILAAVALPQYEKAVLKSRAATGLSLLSALDQAQTVYHMANGAYATDVEALGVDLGKVICHVSDSTNGAVYCQGFNQHAKGLFFEWNGWHTSAKKRWVCAAKVGNETAQKVCQDYYQEWQGKDAPHDALGYTYYNAPR